MKLKVLLKKACFMVFARERLRVADAIEKVLASRHYCAGPKADTSVCMCTATFFAAEAGIIESDHRWEVRKRILRFIKGRMFLKRFLMERDLHEVYEEDGVYRAWYVEYIKYLRGEEHKRLK